MELHVVLVRFAAGMPSWPARCLTGGRGLRTESTPRILGGRWNRGQIKCPADVGGLGRIALSPAFRTSRADAPALATRHARGAATRRAAVGSRGRGTARVGP